MPQRGLAALGRNQTSLSLFTTEVAEDPARPSAATKLLSLSTTEITEDTEKRESRGARAFRYGSPFILRSSNRYSLDAIRHRLSDHRVRKGHRHTEHTGSLAPCPPCSPWFGIVFLPQGTGRGHRPRAEFARENKIGTSSGTNPISSSPFLSAFSCGCRKKSTFCARSPNFPVFTSR